MSSEATNRILRDYRDLIRDKSKLHQDGIYFQLDDKNIFHMRAMIIGPSDTPYEKGFYLFDITFPKEYPNLPPKFSYHTNHRGIRFNPNLYTNGTVCLSVLNTWSGAKQGEGWTPSYNISSVLVTIQSMVLNENPLINEPGHELITTSHEKYNEVLRHENFYTAVLRMIKFTPHGFQSFQEIMKKYFLKNIDWYLKKILFYQKKYSKNKTFYCSYQHQSIAQDYIGIYKSFITLAEKLSKEMDIPVELPDPVTQAENLLPNKDDKSGEGSPSGICQGKTAGGKPCGYKAKKDGYCGIHFGQAKQK